MKFTNVTKGPKGLNTKDGPVLVEAGQTVDVELEAAEAKIAKDSGYWGSEAEAKKAAEADAKAPEPKR